MIIEQLCAILIKKSWEGNELGGSYPLGPQNGWDGGKQHNFFFRWFNSRVCPHIWLVLVGILKMTLQPLSSFPHYVLFHILPTNNVRETFKSIPEDSIHLPPSFIPKGMVLNVGSQFLVLRKILVRKPWATLKAVCYVSLARNPDTSTSNRILNTMTHELTSRITVRIIDIGQSSGMSPTMSNFSGGP